MHFTFRNVNVAFESLISAFHNRTIPLVETGSRNGPVLIVPEPVLVTYAHPRERVLFNTARDANPFFHLFESLWMLAGRNDVAPLKYYVHDIDQFSDDGETFHGAYGHRWRHSERRQWNTGGDCLATPLDQLDEIVQELREEPGSRRVVLQMWDVDQDLGVSVKTKDKPCLAGEVKFRSPEGEVAIRNLAKLFQTRKGFKFPVYSVDTIAGDQRLCWMTNAWKSGVKKVYRLTFDNGSTVRLTCNHTLFKKQKMFDGQRCVGLSVQECQVGDLSVGDRVLAAMPKDAKCRLDIKGYKRFKRNIYKNTSFTNMVLEHREYLNLLYNVPLAKQAGMSCHHLNEDKADNRADNLEYVRDSWHFSMDKLSSDNPHCKMSEDAKADRGEKHSKSLKAHWGGMDKETRRAYGQRRAFRTARQWELIEEYRSSKSNHKIVKIEPAGVVPVYDFTIAGRHNAVLSNGVVCHNCNTHAYLSVREHSVPEHGAVDKYLNITVCNRSNDLVWGMLGANVVHFSFLQEYLANCLGVEVGVYNQFTNNLHVYTERWKPRVWLGEYQRDMHSSPQLVYGASVFPPEIRVGPLVPTDESTRIFDQSCNLFVGGGIDGGWDDPFLRNVAQPMCAAFRAHKRRNYTGDNGALRLIEAVQASDWRLAGRVWLQRRYERWYAKNLEHGNKQKQDDDRNPYTARELLCQQTDSDGNRENSSHVK